MTFEHGDELGLWTSPLTSNQQSKRLLDGFPRSMLGSIIVTTRDRHAIIEQYNAIQYKAVNSHFRYN
jgi:hypothetical protein